MSDSFKTGIIVQARSNSTRLPQKVNRPFFEEQSILDILIKRLKNLGLPIVLATTTNSADQVIVETAERNRVESFRGDEADVLERFLGVIEKHNFDFVIRICADNPFLSVELINVLLAKADKLDYDFDYLSHSWKDIPAILTHFGVFAELARSSALKRIKSEGADPSVFEHVTYFLYTNPEKFQVEFLPLEESFFTYADIRLTVDTSQDFEVAQTIYSALARDGKSTSIANVNEYLSQKPDLLKRMSAEIQKNKKR